MSTAVEKIAYGVCLVLALAFVLAWNGQPLGTSLVLSLVILVACGIAYKRIGAEWNLKDKKIP